MPTLGLGLSVSKPAAPRGFGPDSVANLECWFDASSLAGADASAVASWTDASGNGNTAVQGTGANQPILKTNIINGHSVVRFDGSNDVLTIATEMTIARLFFVVAYGASGNFADYAGVFSGQASTEAWMGEGGTDNWYNPANTYRVDGVLTNDGAPIDSFHVVDASVPVPATETGWRISGDRGFGRHWHGDIAEIIGYSSDPSAGDIQRIEAYLATKYGL